MVLKLSSAVTRVEGLWAEAELLLWTLLQKLADTDDSAIDADERAS
eukprot:SAG11_NODE_1478_length_4837_cov_1.608485_6_plen_45_part_01